MSTILLFHAVRGLNDAVLSFATSLREAGHTVATPDLYDGETFETLDDGIAKREAIGVPELLNRAWAAANALPEDIYYAGFSMGADWAQILAGERPGAKGCLLLHSAVPLDYLKIEKWPETVPVEFHATRDDPWVDADEVAVLQTRIPNMTCHWYAGDQHLFADPTSPDFVPEYAAQMLASAVRFFE